MTAEEISADRVRGCWRAALTGLRDAGVREVFGLPGDDLNALVVADELGLDFTVCRDQRNAVFMATGYAMQSGALGVVVVGKGPAVTNTVTGMLEARYSAAPVLVLCAGTAPAARGSGAFQEFDQLPVARSVAKWAERVDHPDRVGPMLRRAIMVATHGVPGPVYLELPDQLSEEDIPLGGRWYPVQRPVATDMGEQGVALAAVRAAKRPVLLVGGGMRTRGAGELLARFAEHIGAAVVCTASGRGAVDESLPSFLGLAGLYSPGAVNALWRDTDCVVAVGSRLEETATFGWPDRLRTAGEVVQINVDAGEFNTDFAGPMVLGDGCSVLADWLERLPAVPGWSATVHGLNAALHEEHAAVLEKLRAQPELYIAEVLDELDKTLPGNRILVQENGLQDMWSYFFPTWRCIGDGGSIVPSEQTSLGCGAAAAVGVRRAAPDRPVVAFVGDGAFAMFDADLPTAKKVGGVLYVVLRNGGYGWLQAQLGKHEGVSDRHSFVDPDTVRPEGEPIPGVPHIVVDDKKSLGDCVSRAWALCERGATVVLSVPVRMSDAVFAPEELAGEFPQAPS
ncbi:MULTISPECIES: thiamine pyrophosphate-binding protein [unclassified Nocardia]|uniref:thiamine pyrophosphate-binding protein n=1 Tax=unclassified Nocardia TaxID=2637762 RepID=UPI001CE3E20F|nr:MULTISPECIES: thiamine pyrophosphate-binding protein [unclassified Nocardia]